jgi:hypothetical protein
MEDLSAYGQAHAEALAKAIAAFAEKYNRYPEWDILRFRGGYTTFKVLVEIWEEL